jgi:hypothetical protein
MKGRIADTRTWLNLASVLILVAGLGSALVIYQRAAPEAKAVLGYEEAGGSVYPVMPEDSKQYERSMELYGGKANLLADQLRRWFLGLWQGKSLALTVACITLLISLGIFFAANFLPPPPEPDGRHGPLPGSREKGQDLPRP